MLQIILSTSRIRIDRYLPALSDTLDIITTINKMPVGVLWWNDYEAAEYRRVETTAGGVNELLYAVQTERILLSITMFPAATSSFFELCDEMAMNARLWCAFTKGMDLVFNLADRPAKSRAIDWRLNNDLLLPATPPAFYDARGSLGLRTEQPTAIIHRLQLYRLIINDPLVEVPVWTTLRFVKQPIETMAVSYWTLLMTTFLPGDE